MTDRPITTQYQDSMNALAQGLDDVLNGAARPKKVGFALFVFEFDRLEPGRVNYISNGARETMIVAVKEWLARAEGRVVSTETQQ